MDRGRLFFLLCFSASLKEYSSGDVSDCATVASSQAHALLQSKSVRKSQVAANSSLRVAYPKVLRSMYDKSTLFYHVHMPKTGGSTVARLLASDVCAPFKDLLDVDLAHLHKTPFCGVECELGFTDNEFACADPNRNQAEHWTFVFNQRRAEDLKAKSGAKKIVYVTTLRLGSDRVVSQWKAELGYGSFIPPVGVGKFSMKSLQHYILGRSYDGKHNLGKGWLTGTPSLRSNYQVGMLGSRLGLGIAVRPRDLEVAKKVLLTGDWVIGFTPCIDALQERLLEYMAQVHGGYKHKAAPLDNEAKQQITIDQETQDMLDRHAHLDNALFDWAWSLAKNGTDSRFSRTC